MTFSEFLLEGGALVRVKSNLPKFKRPWRVIPPTRHRFSDGSHDFVAKGRAEIREKLRPLEFCYCGCTICEG